MAMVEHMRWAAARVFSSKIGGCVSALLVVAGLVPQLYAQQYQIASVSPSFIGAGANGATLTLSGSLPDFTQGTYQVCFYTGFGSTAAITPTLVKGAVTLAVPGATIQGIPGANFTAANHFSVPGSITVVPQGTVCSGSFDATLTNLYYEPISEPLPGAYDGPLNVPQTNAATNVQAAPVNVVLSGSSFTAATIVKLGSFGVVASELLSSSTLSFAVPAAFSSSPVGTTAAISVCNSDGYCATGVTLTVMALVPSAGALTVTPTPVTTAGTTTLTAQFKRDPANGTTLPESGAPSGSVTFTAAGNSVGTAPLVLDPTAVFVPVASTTQVATVTTPVISPAAGTYQTPQTITIADATPGASILYTLDGSTPTASSAPYTGPITVSTAATVSAIAVAAGYRNSSPVSQAYVIFVPTPTSVAFVAQPTTSATNTVIAPPITVQILDQKGNPITSSTALVMMSIGTNPANGTLSGKTSVNAVNGIATFADLSIDAIANGYTLTASSDGLTSAASTPFNITPYPITVKLFDPLIGVASTLPGTFTLSHPSPSPNGVVVSLASSATGNVTVSPSTVNVPAGGTTGSFTYTGVAPGPATITASAPNYLAGSGTVTATNSLVSLGTIPTVSPGQSVSLALSLATNAPAGGVTVNFTSSNPGVATITPSLFIPQGQRTAATNPQITGVAIGTTTVTATAQNYAPDTRAVNVSVTATFKPTSVSVNLSTFTTTTLNISAPAQVGGLAFTLTSDDPTKATVVPSVTIPQGQTSVSVPITGVKDGTNTIIRANTPGVTEATVQVTVSSKLSASNVLTGVNMESPTSVSLPVTPPTAVSVTVTSSDPTIATISMSSTVVGTPSLTFTNVISGGGLPSIYVQGQKVGSTTLTVSAPGYTSSTATITVDPSGFSFAGFNNTGLSTTSFSSATSIFVYPTLLAPGTLNYVTNTISVSPGLGAISVAVTSSDTGIGTITTSPVVFNGGDGAKPTTFLPSSAGTTTVALGAAPAGYSTSAQYTQFVVTATAPVLSISGVTTGVNMEVGTNVSLPVTPPSARAVTVTSSDPSIATISMTSTTVGTASVTFPNVSTAGSLPTIYIQGQKVGTITVTVSAAGYTDGKATMTVNPSGFSFAGFNNTGLATTSFSSATNIFVYPTILNASLHYASNSVSVSPGLGAISVPVTSSDTNVGTMTLSPVVFNGGDGAKLTSFKPSSSGTTTIAIGATPAGYSTSANYTQFVATVTAPLLSISPVTTGVNMEVGTNVSLPVAPPSARPVTVTSSDPSIATISMSSTTVGTVSVTFPSVSNAGGLPAIYVQGQKVGTVTLTVSAEGYTDGKATITVSPSGFSFAGFNNSGLATTTFSSPTSVYVYPTILNASLNYVSNNVLVSPGLGAISIPVTSSNTNVGNITLSPIVFNGGDGGKPTTFQPSSAGTTVVAIAATPAGYSTSANYTQFTVTATAPVLNINSITTGLNLETTTSASLPVPPPNPITVTITSDDPAVALISKSATTAGVTSLTFTNITSAGGLPSIYVQGQSIGSTTLTVSAPGYSNDTAVVTVNPSAFSFAGLYSGGLNTTAGASPTTLQIYPTILNPGTLTYSTDNVLVNPGVAPLGVTVTSSNTTTGTITTSPVVFNGGDGAKLTTFKPNAVGTSTITITPPQGFSTPTQYGQITVTVQ